jgi:glycosyltransferase involved in cell wall biosynthesis
LINKKGKIFFYARLKDLELFRLVDFYYNDIRIFEELGYEVIIANTTERISEDYDYYFIWWWSSGFIPIIKAKKFKKPIISIGNLHYDDPSIQGYKARPFYIKSMIKYSLRNTDVQIATSKIEYDGIKKLKAKNPCYIYHAIDSSKYHNININKENVLFTLSHLTKGNFERKKIKEIIKAFKIVLTELPEYKLYIGGDTNDDGYPELRKLVDEENLNSNIKFLGRISDEEKIRYYNLSKIYVQPTSFEGFGVAIGESMACGTPVVTSEKGAVPEVAGDCALYVDPDNVNDIARGIIKLVKDKDLYKKLSESGKERIIKEFSYAKRKTSLQKIFNDLK